MTVDLVIRGGTVMTPHGRLEGGVAVDGGVIVAVAADEALPAGRQTIDVRARHVLPGVIDSPVHFSASPSLSTRRTGLARRARRAAE